MKHKLLQGGKRCLTGIAAALAHLGMDADEILRLARETGHRGHFSMSSDGASAEILIYDVIDEYWGVGAKDFVQQLLLLGDVETITVRINSSGGDVFEGLAIYNALKMHKATVNVQIDALAASIATVIAMAGDSVSISDSGMMMVHNPSGLCWGEASDMRDMADLLDKIRSGTMLGSYARTGMSVEQLTAIMDAETWYTAQEAVDAHWVDALTVAPAKSAAAKMKFDLSAFKHPPTAQKPKAANPSCTCPCAGCVAGDCDMCETDIWDYAGCTCPQHEMSASRKEAAAASAEASLQEAALIAANLRSENLRLAESI